MCSQTRQIPARGPDLRFGPAHWAFRLGGSPRRPWVCGLTHPGLTHGSDGQSRNQQQQNILYTQDAVAGAGAMNDRGVVRAARSITDVAGAAMLQRLDCGGTGSECSGGLHLNRSQSAVQTASCISWAALLWHFRHRWRQTDATETSAGARPPAVFCGLPRLRGNQVCLGPHQCTSPVVRAPRRVTRPTKGLVHDS